MFNLSVKIVDDKEMIKTLTVEDFEKEWGTLYGEVDLRIGSYRWEALMIPELWGDPPQGHEKLDYWIEAFLDAAIELSGQGRYAAFWQIDMAGVWYIFERQGSVVHISVADDSGVVFTDSMVDNAHAIKECFLREPAAALKKRENACADISTVRFCEKVVDVVSDFLREMLQINAALTDSKLYKRIAERLVVLKNLKIGTFQPGD